MEVGGILSQLMLLDAGGQKFVADCFLLLSPEEIKSCRLVCRQWDRFIMKEMWGNARGKKELEAKLVNRWKTVDPTQVEIGQPFFSFISLHQSVTDVAGDDRFAFCGLENGNVRVYKLDGGDLVTELAPSRRLNSGHSDTVLAASDGILASITWDASLTVWQINTTPAEPVYSLIATDFRCTDASCDHQGHNVMRSLHVVDGSKIAILIGSNSGKLASPLVITRNDGNSWQSKKLACINLEAPLFTNNHFSSDGEWLALFLHKYAPSQKVTLWKGENEGQDIAIPGQNYGDILSLKFPFLVFLAQPMSTSDSALINVYKLTNEKGELAPNAALVKSIDMGRGIFRHCHISNKFFLGVTGLTSDWRPVLNLLEKKQLHDSSVLPEEIERRRLEVCSWNTKINTTSLVSVKSGRAEHGIGANFLVVGDFWMTD